jgi:hypothetical protein
MQDFGVPHGRRRQVPVSIAEFMADMQERFDIGE